jgi:hypothetical protein
MLSRRYSPHQKCCEVLQWSHMNVKDCNYPDFHTYWTLHLPIHNKCMISLLFTISRSNFENVKSLFFWKQLFHNDVFLRRAIVGWNILSVLRYNLHRFVLVSVNTRTNVKKRFTKPAADLYSNAVPSNLSTKCVRTACSKIVELNRLVTSCYRPAIQQFVDKLKVTTL